MKRKERHPKYWICDHCVKTKHPDWITKYPIGGNTALKGLCGHCEWPDEEVLTPVVDYKNKGQKISSGDWD